MSVLAEEPTNERPQACHFPGPYDFTISLGSMNEENAEHVPKNVRYTFSSKLNRLYVKKEAVCPFAIFTSGIPPLYSKIKIIVYSEDNVPVMRCPAHTGELSEFVSPLHYMRSENPLALYDCCEKTGELSIQLPFNKPQDVDEGFENMRFLCSSKHCIKKELFLKFSLIDSTGEVLGYHEFGLHVSSTPGRDRWNHEEVKTKRKRKMLAGSDCTQRPVLQQQDEVFKLLAKDRFIHEWLALINRGLELNEAIPIDIQEKYLKKYHARPSRSGSTSSTSSATRTSPDTAASSSSDTRYILRRILVKS